MRLDSTALCIGSTSMGIPTVAADNCMISDSYIGAQIQNFMAQDNASRVRYVFTITTSKTMLIAPDKLKEVLKISLQFNNITIQYSSKETHLGIARTDDGRST